MGNGEVVLFGLNVVVGTNGVVLDVVVVLVVLKIDHFVIELCYVWTQKMITDLLEQKLLVLK